MIPRSNLSLGNVPRKDFLRRAAAMNKPSPNFHHHD